MKVALPEKRSTAGRWEIASVRSPSGERLGNTILALQSGERASLSPKGHGFEALAAVLERHTAGWL